MDPLNITLTSEQLERLSDARAEVTRATEAHRIGREPIEGEKPEVRGPRMSALYQAVEDAHAARVETLAAVWHEALGTRHDEIAPLLT